MIKALFDREDKLGELFKAMHSWIGTPFRHYCCVKHRGVDCTLLIGSVLLEVGIITKLEYDYYARDWHKNANGRELVLENVVKHIIKYIREGYVFLPLDSKSDFINGDFLGFSTIKQNITHHTSIYFKDLKGAERMVHSIRGRGVYVAPFDEYWKEHITFRYRIYEVG